MSSTPHKSVFKHLVALAVLALAACSYRFEVSVDELTTLTPKFRIHSTKAFGFRNFQPEIKEILVLDTSPPDDNSRAAGNSRVVWKITSDRAIPVAEVVYGSTPDGFRVEVAAKPLAPDVKYNFAAWTPGGGGGILFSIESPDAMTPTQ